MKNNGLYFKLTALAAALWLLISPALAGAPLKINFQGRLEQGGQPAEGSKTFEFRIHDALSDGNQVWAADPQTITLSGGVFSAILSAGTYLGSPTALSTATFSGARYVEIIVDGVPLLPRQEMVSAPYALVAQALAPDAQIPATSIAAASVNDSHVVLTTAAISSGRFNDSRVLITTGAFAAFNGPDQLVKLDGAGKIPAGNLVETDPAFAASAAAGITVSSTTNWTTAHGWGNHAGVGYLTSFSETDPAFAASAAAGITVSSTTNWNAAYVWGDHAGVGYLTSFSETDPAFAASAAAGITVSSTTNWTTAHGWGDHSTVGYATNAGVSGLLSSYAALSATQAFTGSNVFTSTAAFTAQHATVPGVTVSSGLVVAAGRLGVGTAAPNSALNVNGPIALGVRTAAALNVTLGEDDSTLLADPESLGNDVTVNLPDAAGCAGRIYTIKRISDPDLIAPVFGIIVLPAAAQKIDQYDRTLSRLTLELSPLESVTLQSTGSGWIILSWYNTL